MPLAPDVIVAKLALPIEAVHAQDDADAVTLTAPVPPAGGCVADVGEMLNEHAGGGGEEEG